VQFQLNLPKIEPEPGVEYWLNVSFVLSQEPSWAPRDTKSHGTSFRMPVGVAGPRVQLGSQVPLEIADQEGSVTLSDPQFALRLNKALGLITQFRYKGVDLLERGPCPDVWRAPTNNDRGAWFQMVRHPEIYLNLDLKQMGASGIDSWTPNAYPMEQYRIQSGVKRSYRYRLTPVDSPEAIETKSVEKF
jgi:beta-galactosidase/beta-glucuronidase